MTTVEMKTEKGRGLPSSEIFADTNDLFDLVLGILKTLNRQLALDDEVGVGFVVGEEMFPIVSFFHEVGF